MTKLGWCLIAVLVLASSVASAELDAPRDRPNGAYYAMTTAEGTVLIRWVVSSLDGVLGFNLYRSTNPDSLFALVNSELIPAISPGEYEDTTVEPHTTYWYGLYVVMEAGGEELLAGGLVQVTTGGSSAAEESTWGSIKVRFLERRLPN